VPKTKDLKEVFLLGLLLILNVLVWAPTDDAVLTARTPYTSDSYQFTDPNFYVGIEAVNKAREICLNSGKVAYIEGFVPHQGDKTTYVRCGNGDTHTF